MNTIFNQLKNLKSAKRARPELLIGVMGCMVENYKTKLADDFPHVDILIGTRNIRDLPDAIARARDQRANANVGAIHSSTSSESRAKSMDELPLLVSALIGVGCVMWAAYRGGLLVYE